MGKFWAGLAAIAMVLLITFTACQSGSTQKMVSEELGIDVSNGSETSHYDTHGGNGDGISHIVLQFNDDATLEEISASGEWDTFPLDKTMQALVYGTQTGTTKTGPYLNDGEGNPLVPEIQNGYYRLIDRHSDKETGILERPSFNFTIGLYDTDTNTLYFCKLDT